MVPEAEDLPTQGLKTPDLHLPERRGLELPEEPASDRESGDFRRHDEPMRRPQWLTVAPSKVGLDGMLHRLTEPDLPARV
jgi:hypothetical protein